MGTQINNKVDSSDSCLQRQHDQLPHFPHQDRPCSSELVTQWKPLESVEAVILIKSMVVREVAM